MKKVGVIQYSQDQYICAADFSLLNLPKGKSLGRSKPTTNPKHKHRNTLCGRLYYIQALLNCLL